MMKNEMDVQDEFLKKIRLKISSDRLAANEIAALLNLSKSEAYNKLSGKSQLTLTQIQVLSNKYEVNFEITPRSNIDRIRVRYTPFHRGIINMTEYLKNLNKFMSQLSQEKNCKLTCATDDIPFFHLFKYPELAAFKLHFWESRIVEAVSNKPEKIFDIKKIDKKNIKAAYNLHKIYSQIPCLEIWTKSYLLITPDQLKYAYESQLIKDKSIAKLICDQLVETLNDIEGYAINKSKSRNSIVPFDWYQCDVVGNVSYLADASDHQYCFLRFNTFNNLQSNDEHLCREVEMWLTSLLNNSTGYTGQGSKHRNIYLDSARKNIESLKALF
ncbi:MAG: hypothetical protein NVS3B19_19620 [Ginsengibacter sp.]